MPKNLILEIGTEEMPAEDMNQVRSSFHQVAKEYFTKNRLDYERCSVFSAPRRLTLFVNKMAEKQNDKHESVRGPSAAIAFDDKGNPTKAGKGFAKRQNMDVDDLIIKDGYVFAEKKDKGKQTDKLLQKILPQLVKDIDFPKTMRWGNLDFKFIRPIKWILAIFGDKTINFELAGVKSSNMSRGHRFLSGKPFEINNADNYFDKLKDYFVIVKQNERKDKIIEQLNSLKKDVGKIEILNDLLEEVIELVEFPTAFIGKFDEEFLQLPDEVLITSMVKHQRYFPVRDKNNKLINKFVSVRDGNEENIDEVRHGNEMVIRARLADARFFYEEDLKTSLADRKDDLKDVVFQEKLGSMYEKIERLKKLSRSIIQTLEFDKNDREILLRAADLCKNDLVTEMVDEFPSLQGIIGGEYVLANGERKEVAQAISEHYKPNYPGDELPKSKWGKILSLVDKLDNITSHISQGMKTTGSQDPFALRRQASGIIRILSEAKLKLNLTDLIKESLDILQIEKGDMVKEIRDFFLQRLQTYLEDKDIRYDVINAVISVRYNNCADAVNRAQAVMSIREKDPELFIDLIQGMVRAGNLASKAENNYKINENLFEKEGEKQLYREYKKIKEKIKANIKKKNYEEALKDLVKLKDSIDFFLDNVVVMVDNENIKKNRLALLQRIARLAEPILDIEEIALDD
ncbi:MAG: glycine--tRNA ligase subunit beta [Halanaerobiales bacterium]